MVFDFFHGKSWSKFLWYIFNFVSDILWNISQQIPQLWDTVTMVTEPFELTAMRSLIHKSLNAWWNYYTPAQRSWRGGILDSPCPSVCPSVRPSVCRRHGFRSISQVCFGNSISNFICLLMVAIGRSLLIFSDVTFKMAAWRPYWIFWFPDSSFTLALNINFKLQRHNTYVYG